MDNDFFGGKVKILLFFLSLLLPVLGHVSAYIYYSNFGIEYFRFSNWSSGLVFLWEHFDVVISTSAVVLLLYLFVAFVLFCFHLYKDDKKSNTYKFKSKHPPFYYISNFVSFVVVVLLTYYYVGRYEYLSVESRFYIPYSVVTVSRQEFDCVKPLGTIGGYLVLVGNENKIILKEEQISSVYPLSVESPNLAYDLEFPSVYPMWNEFWGESCANKGAGYNRDAFPSYNVLKPLIPVFYLINLIFKG